MIDLQGVVALLVGTVVVILVGARHAALRGPLFAGYAVRVAALLYDVTQAPLPMGDDGVNWSYTAASWAHEGVLGTFAQMGTGKVLYVWLMSVLYAMFGVSPTMVQVLNVICGTLVIRSVFLLARTLGATPGTARQSAWVMAFFPTSVAYSAVLLREAAVTLPLSLGALHLARWHRSKTGKNWVKAVLSLLVASAFHSGAFGLLAGASAWLALRWHRTLAARGVRLKSFVAMVATGVVLAGVLSTGFGLDKFKNIEIDDVSGLRAHQIAGVAGRTQYLQEWPVESTWDVLWQAPVRIVYFLFTPFPWMVTKAVDLIGLVDSAFYFVVIVALYRGRRRVVKNETARLVLFGFAATVFVFALGVTNAGTAMRHRAKLLPVLVAVAAVITRRHRARSAVTAGATGGRPETTSYVAFEGGRATRREQPAVGCTSVDPAPIPYVERTSPAMRSPRRTG